MKVNDLLSYVCTLLLTTFSVYNFYVTKEHTLSVIEVDTGRVSSSLLLLVWQQPHDLWDRGQSSNPSEHSTVEEYLLSLADQALL